MAGVALARTWRRHEKTSVVAGVVGDQIPIAQYEPGNANARSSMRAPWFFADRGVVMRPLGFADAGVPKRAMGKCVGSAVGAALD
jgi:hypothetical protein